MCEISGTNYIVSRRMLDHRRMVNLPDYVIQAGGKKFSLPSCSTRPDYPDGGRRYSKSGYRQRTSYFSSDRSALESAVSVSSPVRARKGCSASWAQASHSTAKNQCYYRGYPPYDATRCPARIVQAWTHWSTRSMAKALGVSKATVCRIWQQHNLKPHLVETFKLSRDKQFVEKLQDIVGLYLNPPDKALVLCVDEKSQIQALDRTQLLLPLRPGIPARQTHDYTRHGTTTLFAALSMLDGKVIGDCMPRHRHQEFIRFLQLINVQTPLDLDLHLIVDNYGTHKHPRVHSWLKRHPRFHLHFIPTSSSWLNLVERWFREITDKQIRRGSFQNVPSLVAAIQEYIDTHNQNPKVFIWSAPAERIMNKIAKCKEALETLH